MGRNYDPAIWQIVSTEPAEGTCQGILSIMDLTQEKVIYQFISKIRSTCNQS
jgi:hypothetical protein